MQNNKEHTFRVVKLVHLLYSGRRNVQIRAVWRFKILNNARKTPFYYSFTH